MALALKPERPKYTPTRRQFRSCDLSRWASLLRRLHRSSVWGERPASRRVRSAELGGALLKECGNCFFGFCRPHAHGKLLELTSNRLLQLFALGPFHQVLTNPQRHCW